MNTFTNVLPCGVSRDAFDLIVAEEVSSEAYYRAHYQQPERPGGASGITIGIGYDCGWATPAEIRSDWTGKLAPEMVEALVKVAGLTGDDAQAKLAWIKPKVAVPWEAALAVFSNVDLPKWAETVRKELPNTDVLSPDCFGVLVSLAYNRGASFSKPGARYAEMRAIKTHLAARQVSAIPDDIRAMKRLWTTPSVRGVRDRRNHEAALFERGLKAAPSARTPTPDPSPQGGGGKDPAVATLAAPAAPPAPAATSVPPKPEAAPAASEGAVGRPYPPPPPDSDVNCLRRPSDYHSPLWHLGAAVLPSIFKKG